MRSKTVTYPLTLPPTNSTSRHIYHWKKPWQIIFMTGMRVELREGKPTTGGYLGIAHFFAYDQIIPVMIQVSLRNDHKHKSMKGTMAVIENDYIPAYTLVHLPHDEIVRGKMQALFFLLSGNYPLVKDTQNLQQISKLLYETKINFRNELRRFLPASHLMHLRDFKKILEQKILSYCGEKK